MHECACVYHVLISNDTVDFRSDDFQKVSFYRGEMLLLIYKYEEKTRYKYVTTAPGCMLFWCCTHILPCAWLHVNLGCAQICYSGAWLYEILVCVQLYVTMCLAVCYSDVRTAVLVRMSLRA